MNTNKQLLSNKYIYPLRLSGSAFFNELKPLFSYCLSLFYFKNLFEFSFHFLSIIFNLFQIIFKLFSIFFHGVSVEKTLKILPFRFFHLYFHFHFHLKIRLFILFVLFLFDIFFYRYNRW